MNKTISRCIFISALFAYFIISVCEPWVLSDNNTFLSNFVNHEFLNFLGVIVAITLASTANLHLQFNSIEDAAKRSILPKTRSAVHKSAHCLIAMFAFGVLIVLSKPLLPQVEIAMALINGLALLIVLFNILVLIDITKLAFSIMPTYKILEDDKEDDEPDKT